MPNLSIRQRQAQIIRVFQAANVTRQQAEPAEQSRFGSENRAVTNANNAQLETIKSNNDRANKALHLTRAYMLDAGLNGSSFPKKLDDLLPEDVAASADDGDPVARLEKAVAEMTAIERRMSQGNLELKNRRKRRATIRKVTIIAAIVVPIVIIVALAVAYQSWSYQRGLANQYNRGMIALETEEWETARNEFSALLKLEPGYKDAEELLRESYYLPGKAAFDTGEWEAARNELGALLQLEPGYKDVEELLRASYYLPGKAAFDAGEWEAASSELGILVAFDAEYKDARKLLEETFLNRGARRNPKDDALYLFVPAGEFIMGSNDGDDDEQPVHAVMLDGFWIMQTEVTNAQYVNCVDAGDCRQPNNDRWNDSNYSNHPVTHVNWQQAHDYAAWTDGRLPTEAEWERACRGIDGRTYPWGNDAPNSNLLNYDNNVHRTTAVGAYANVVSPVGALDMAGNVREWTADWYDKDYYADSPAENPAGLDSGNTRVVRGGSYGSGPERVRCADRGRYPQGLRDDYSGFRVARSSLNAP